MKNEKLFRELGNVDDDLLEKAWQVDDLRKLNAYAAKSQKRAFWPRVAAIAACAAVLILVFSVAMPGPLQDKASNDGPQDMTSGTGKPLPLPSIGEIDSLKINSIDKLNYYAAIRLLSGVPKLSIKETGYTLSLLNHGTGVDKPEITAPGNTEGPPVGNHSQRPPNDGNEDIYYYALNPDDPFFVNKVSIFQIQLTDENGFLASQLGTGLVDVVITEECIWGDTMITFRNGEKFFSCLSNGWSPNRQTGGCQWNFSTHKYIDGFYIVKNLEQENYAFYVDMDAKGQAIALSCRESENGGYRVDRNVQIASATQISNKPSQFTIAELESYFNSTQPA